MIQSMNNRIDAETRIEQQVATLKADLANAEAVSAVLAAVNTTSNELESLSAALDSVKKSFDWQYGSSWVLDPEEQVLKFCADSGEVDPEFVRATKALRFHKGEGLVGGAFATGEVQWVPELTKLAGYKRAAAAARSHLTAAICIPLRDESGEVFAALDFYASSLSLSTRRLEALTSVGIIVAANITRHRRVERERRQARELREKVDQILAAVSAAAEGNLTQEVGVSGSDEIGRLGAGVETLIKTLRSNVSTISRNSQALAATSEEMHAVGEQIQNAAETGATRAQTVAESSVQISQSIQSVANSSNFIAASIQEIAKNSSKAAEIAKAAVKVVERTSASIEELRERSRQIGSVVETISGIAQQTNMLALNAAIEAAHAGEVGRGFAVVATEVKQLSSETSRATLKITQEVRAIQSSTQGVSDCMHEIGDIVNEFDGLQESIALSVRRQATTTQEITRMTAAVAEDGRSISASVAGLAESARDTSTGLGEMQRAAEELASMATELQSFVDRFRCEPSEPAKSQRKKSTRRTEARP